MSYLQILGLVVLIFFCIFAIADRICKCFEQCNMAKTFKKYMEMATDESKNEEK